MTIAAILKGRGQVVTVAGELGLMDAVALLARHRIGAVPVMDGDSVAGIFSERDVIRGLAEHGPAALERTVAEAMTVPAITVSSDEPVIAALSLMTHRRIRHLPVVDDGVLLDFVSIGDLVKHRIERIEADAAAMRDYIQQA